MSLKKKFAIGVGYTTLSQFLSYGIRLGSTLILTRLLAPDLMGLMAVGATFSYAAILLSDLGLRNAIIQDERADDADYRNSVWNVAILRGLLIGVVVWGTAGLVWWFQTRGSFSARSVYADSRLVQVLLLLGLAEIIRGAEAVEVMYRERKLDFKALFIFQTSKQLVGTVITVIWAWLDPGVFALCSGALFGHLYTTVLSHVWLRKSPAKLAWNGKDFRYILSAGKLYLVSSALTFLINSIDRIYLASSFTPTDLGIYSTATTLGLLAFELSTRLGSSVILPVVSEKLRNDSAGLTGVFYKIRRPFEYFALAAGFFILAFGDDIIRLMYDSRYHDAGPILRVFGFLTLLIAYAPAVDTYLAMGRPGLNSMVSVVRLLGLIVGLMVLVPTWGVMGGAFSLVLSYVCGTLTTFVINIRLGLMDWRQEFRLFSWFLAGFAVVGLLDYLRRAA